MRLPFSLAVLTLVALSFAQQNQAHNPERYQPNRGAVAVSATYQNLAVEPLLPGSFTTPRDNVWASLSNDEARSVVEWLHNSAGLNLTAVINARSWDNRISFVETLWPNKTDVLSWISGKGAKPARWARALVLFGATDEPYTQDFAVGPLPISNATSLQSLDWWSTKGESRIRMHSADKDLEYQFTTEISKSIVDITLDLFNGTLTGEENDTCYLWGIDPLWIEDGKTIQWLGYWANPTSEFDAGALLPQGLYLQIETTGRDPSKWKHLGWFYNGVYYDSTAKFRAAWQAPGFEKATRNVEGTWVSTDQAGEAFKHDEKTPPTPILVDRWRFDLDVDRQYVEWADFSFFVGFSSETGLRLFEIKYAGERIIYELGLEEALAHYAGNDPVHSGTSYLDSYYGLGKNSMELVDGFDCPIGSRFLNATITSDELTVVHRNAICMFEMDTNYPMQRHTSGSYLSITKNIVFVIKHVASVGNYDYTISYTFYQDGTIDTAVQASGYIKAAFHAKNYDYGYKIYDGLSGAMHDHVLSFRADIDILGTKNTFTKHSVVPATVEYPWSNGVPRNTMKLERSRVETEDEGKIDWPANGGSMYLVVNEDEPNKYGEARGYRIVPSSGTVHSTIVESTNLKSAMSFANYDLFVTKRKDTEPKIAHSMNVLDPANPIIDFEDHFDGENLVQEDLVLHFNLGMHHVPHTGDLPNTVMTTSRSSVMITPHNYLLSDPSRRSKQQVSIKFKTGNETKATVRTFGAAKPSNECHAIAFPDLEEYSGDFVLRKFPYDPVELGVVGV